MFGIKRQETPEWITVMVSSNFSSVANAIAANIEKILSSDTIKTDGAKIAFLKFIVERFAMDPKTGMLRSGFIDKVSSMMNNLIEEAR